MGDSSSKSDLCLFKIIAGERAIKVPGKAKYFRVNRRERFS
ncbi:hypothetical protein MtrunA17_Chr4g0012411 [Medicago truncatula]|uniref:Uncharacterized protein n=1 Tax=Medicago truncatula TaxID=3880 RepID=A0A396I6S3_MEDTR|nr:hypothetical protein MtrunA17_Chr4g0012411 [Medicago truncatula]